MRCAHKVELLPGLSIPAAGCLELLQAVLLPQYITVIQKVLGREREGGGRGWGEGGGGRGEGGEGRGRGREGGGRGGGGRGRQQ